MTSDLFDITAAAQLPPDLVDALARSRAERGVFGERVFHVFETGSTNDLAARLAAGGAAEGTTVVAQAQSAGRGRLGRSWFSPPGAGLYASVVMRPDADGERPLLPSLVTLLAGVALVDAVRETSGLLSQIKWPNDVMVGRRKLGGILAEASAQGPTLDWVVLGFGINVCETAYPRDVAARATSLEAELGRTVDRAWLLVHVLVNLAGARDALRRDQVTGLLDRWLALSPSARGADVEWRARDGVRRGRTAGLDDDGALRVETGGRIERVIAGEITWL